MNEKLLKALNQFAEDLTHAPEMTNAEYASVEYERAAVKQEIGAVLLSTLAQFGLIVRE